MSNNDAKRKCMTVMTQEVSAILDRTHSSAMILASLVDEIGWSTSLTVLSKLPINDNVVTVKLPIKSRMALKPVNLLITGMASCYLASLEQAGTKWTY